MAGQPSSRSDKKHNYKQIYFEVPDTTIAMLNDRFAESQSFEFLDLINPLLFRYWGDNVPNNKMQLLRGKYSSFFNMSALESQLLFVYKDTDFYKESPMEFLHYIHHYNLETCVQEALKLLTMFGVTAVSSASVERSFSCLRRVILKEKKDQNQLHNLNVLTPPKWHDPHLSVL